MAEKGLEKTSEALSIGSSDINKICESLGEFSGRKGGMNTIWLVIGLIILCCCLLSSSAGAGFWFWRRDVSQ